MEKKTITTKARAGRWPENLNVKAHAQRRDGHACGAHAVYALLRFHGRSVSYKDVKDQLGTDYMLPPVPGRDRLEALMLDWQYDWRGTTATDVCNVLWQHRCSVRTLPVHYIPFRRALEKDISAGQPVLIATEYSPGTLHWVVVAGLSPRGVWVADSLDPTRSVHWTHAEVKKTLLRAFSVADRPGQRVSALMQGVQADIRLLQAMAKPYVYNAKVTAGRKVADKLKTITSKRPQG